jgi:hypothetical protein
MGTGTVEGSHFLKVYYQGWHCSGFGANGTFVRGNVKFIEN